MFAQGPGNARGAAILIISAPTLYFHQESTYLCRMSYHSLENKVLQHLRHTQLLQEDERVLVAHSGGLDSTVLLHLLHRLHFRCGVAHCNFRLRGEESEQDAKFSEALAAELRLPFFCQSFDTEKYASEKKISIQMAARELRYHWFGEIISAHGYTALATAHHSGDQAETILLRLIDGKSTGSLRGIPHRNGVIVRPLLPFSKEELLEYACDKNIQWREDHTNELNTYKRNFIRHEILPRLKTIAPATESSLQHFATRNQEWNLLAEESIQRILSTCVEEVNGTTIVHLQTILRHPAAGTILWKALQPYGFTGDTIQQLLQSATFSGKKFSSQHYTATIDRDRILLEKNNIEEVEEITINATDSTIHLRNGKIFLQQLTRLTKQFPTGNNEAIIDASKLKFPLLLRRWKPGDQFQPLGMTGFKKLSDFFIDNKVPVPVKHQTYLLESNNEIVWVIGHRIDHRYRITEETDKIVHLRYERHND